MSISVKQNEALLKLALQDLNTANESLNELSAHLGSDEYQSMSSAYKYFTHQWLKAVRIKRANSVERLAILLDESDRKALLKSIDDAFIDADSGENSCDIDIANDSVFKGWLKAKSEYVRINLDEFVPYKGVIKFSVDLVWASMMKSSAIDDDTDSAND